ncbi:hypothetical protein OG21DRAFT_918015 [Imleria badia]|nr:hypothetical protein OG21DRAFT_918015 [Imleria badia]
MHHALQIQEIIMNIFCHFDRSGWRRPSSDVAALARTCRAFKEPALDVLWKRLVDTSPLARCLPEAAHYSVADERYSFKRSLTQVEWSILRSYTRRIRFILAERDALDWESVGTFLNPPTTALLFPNVHTLYANGVTESHIRNFLTMPFPSLISLDVRYIAKEAACVLQGSLESFSKFSPNIKRLSIYLREPDITFSKFFSGYICQWRDLHTVDCCHIALDMDTLAHLSRMSALTWLECTLSATLLTSSSDSPLFFPNLNHLILSSDFLDPISRLLSHTRLPVITNFTANIQNCPSKRDFSSFLANVQTSIIGCTIRKLELRQWSGALDGEDGRHVLNFEDLQRCMVFRNLRCIDLNLSWEVDLTDSELLALASAWPRLKHLVINTQWGWNTLGGITPNGLLQLLQTCRSMSRVALAIDTRGYTEFRESPASLGLTLPRKFSIDVIDSLIEAESVPAIAAFFAEIAPCPDFDFTVGLPGSAGESGHERCWHDAYTRAMDILRQRS